MKITVCRLHTHIALSLLVAVLLFCQSCVKNEFNITIKPSPGSVMPMPKAEYYAIDKKMGRVQDMVFVQHDKEYAGRGMTIYPTVGFLYSGSHMKGVFYASRGNKLTVNVSKDGKWMIEGNKESELLSEWFGANGDIVTAHATTRVNKSVETFVKANPKTVAATILLVEFYDRVNDEEGFRKLWSSIDESARDDKLQRALGLSDIPEPLRRIKTMQMRVLGDSIVNIMPDRSAATVFLFWSDPDSRRTRATTIYQGLDERSGINVVDVNMQTDTMNWRYTVMQDSVRKWTYAWMPGAERNVTLEPFQLPSSDFIIVVDRRGNQKYRGTDARQAINAL